MAIEIAINDVPRMAKSGRFIRNGTASSHIGVFRMGRTINGLLAACCNPVVNNWWSVPMAYAAPGVHPIDQAGGGRWTGPITDPWDEVYCIIIAKTSPGINAGTIVFTSRTANATCTVSGAAYAFISGATTLGVSSTGIETIYATITPGAGETITWKMVDILEATRTSL